MKCKVEHTTTPPASFHAVRMPWKAIATTTLMDALVNVLAAVILQANSSIGDAMEDAKQKILRK